jgi:leader peptidase (prepilin peptidase)/N-methyltransferase
MAARRRARDLHCPLLRMSNYEILFSSFAFILGASIGSFLNVCIYRMPRDLSVNEPKRSFCPNCKYQIPWYRNLPLISWLSLRGKCANCGTRISIRYFGVELLTGLLFLAVWLKFWPGSWILALPYWVMVSLFIVATFIDFEHFIIPDEITWGGAAAGLLLSFAIPTLHGVKSPLESGMWALAGAALGFFLLWGVVIAGKAAFGRKRITFKEPAPFKWRREGEVATLETEGKPEPWAEFFPDEKAVMRMKCRRLVMDGKELHDVEISSRYEVLTVNGRDYDLNKLEEFSGEFTEVFFERDAMGFGDVKYMACIGAFLGWKAVLFTVVSASTIGALVGILTLLVGRREWSAKIPFGPYLSLGALLWLFYGPALIGWYMGQLHGGMTAG